MSGPSPSPADAWLDAVRARPASMTQRKLDTVERWPGGIAALIEAACERGVHLLELTDENGETLIAASVYPFKVLA